MCGVISGFVVSVLPDIILIFAVFIYGLIFISGAIWVVDCVQSFGSG